MARSGHTPGQEFSANADQAPGNINPVFSRQLEHKCQHAVYSGRHHTTGSQLTTG